jgi:HEAT repeat protein
MRGMRLAALLILVCTLPAWAEEDEDLTQLPVDLLVDRFERALADEDEVLSYGPDEVLTLLAKRKGKAKSAIPALARHIHNDPEAEYVGGFAEVLAAVGAPALPAMIKLLGHSNSDARGAAIELLGELGTAPGPNPDPEETYQPLAVRKKIVAPLAALLSDPEIGEDIADALGDMGPIAVPALLGALKDPKRRLRAAQALQCGGMGKAALPALPLLLSMCEETKDLGLRRAAFDAWSSVSQSLDYGVLDGRLEERFMRCVAQVLKQETNLGLRRRAAYTLHGRPLPKALVRELIRALGDQDLGVSSSAAAALRGQPSAVEALVAAVNPNRPKRLQVQALNALGSCGTKAAVAALPVLIRGTESGDPMCRDTAFYALARVGPPDLRALPVLVEGLGSEKVGIRIAAIQGLRVMGPRAKPALKALIGLLDRQEHVHGVTTTLIAIGHADAIPACERLLGSKAQLSRLYAARALLELRPKHAAAAALLLRLVRDPTLGSTSSAAGGLGKHGLHVDQALARLKSELQHKESNTRWLAAYALGELAAHAQPLVEDLASMARKDSDSFARAEASRALLQIDPPRGFAVLTTRLALTDAHERSETLLQATQASSGPARVAFLARALRDPYYDLRARAAHGLGRERGAARDRALLSALRDPHWFVRTRAVEALGAGKPSESARAALNGALKDPSEDVSTAAQAALGRH